VDEVQHGPEPDDHGWQRRHQPPSNEVPVLVPLQVAYWLAPVPPAGPMTLVYACPAVGIDEVAVEVDATPLAEAAAQVEVLWPWEPERHDEPAPPTPPDLPEGSWFAADVRRWTTG
jgi:hypothetical protein